MKENKNKKFIKSIILGFFIYILFFGGIWLGTEIARSNDDYLFKCNPYYFGQKYTYPNEPCNNTFVNITGNYCDGVLVCENKLRWS